MSRSITVRLGDVEYTFPPLNIGQVEDLAESNVDIMGRYLDDSGQPLKGKAAVSRRLADATILFRRASPPIPDVRELECTTNELAEAMVAVYRVSRMIVEQPAPGEAVAEARGADSENLSPLSSAA